MPKLFVANLLVKLALEIVCPILIINLWFMVAPSSPWPAVAALGLFNVARIRLVVGRRSGTHWLKRRGGLGLGPAGETPPLGSCVVDSLLSAWSLELNKVSPQ